MADMFNSKMNESMLAKTQFERSLEELKRADEMQQSSLLTVEQRIAKLEADMHKKDEIFKKQEETIHALKNKLENLKNLQNQ
jgi:predicted nuclease with TOPRIM domain